VTANYLLHPAAIGKVRTNVSSIIVLMVKNNIFTSLLKTFKKLTYEKEI